MPDDDDDARPSLEAPQLFKRRRASRTPAEPEPAPAPDEQVFQDAGLDVAPDPAPEPAPVPEPVDSTAVLPTTEARARRGRRLIRAPRTDVAAGAADHSDTTEPSLAPTPAPIPTPAPTRVPRDRSQPLLPGRPAALLVGVLAGLSLVGFTWVGFRGCEALRGTSSCGTGPGMTALVVVFVAAVIVGGYLLSYFHVPDPGATSFLAMGLTAVFCLVFLVDHLDHWSMVLVIPAVSAATYLLSWWVTTTYVDTD